MSVELFDEWLAYGWLEPYGRDWRAAAESTAATVNLLTGWAAVRAGSKIQSDCLADPACVVPPGAPVWSVDVAERVTVLDDDEAAAYWERRFA